MAKELTSLAVCARLGRNSLRRKGDGRECDDNDDNDNASTYPVGFC